MVDTDMVITNSSNSNQYFFRGVHNIRVRRKQDPIQIPLISTSAASNILFRFTGQQDEISFSFYIFDDGNDTSNANSIITINQQMNYLYNSIFTHEFVTSWTLTDQHSRFIPETVITCVINNIETPGEGGVPSFVIGTISVVRGRVTRL